MFDKPMFRLLVALLVTASPIAAAAQTRASQRLAKVKSVACSFQSVAKGDWNKQGEAQGEVSRSDFSVAFEQINTDDGTAVALGTFGPSDIIVRFAESATPHEFCDDWVGVAAEEAEHFALLADRLGALGSAYGELPAHDGLWEAAAATSHDLLARLAVVPLVLEARGLDVTPEMMLRLERMGDAESVAVLCRIYEDEIGHVAVGARWFERLCHERGLDAQTAFYERVRHYFKGVLKPPFNREARSLAGLPAGYYEPLAEASL